MEMMPSKDYTHLLHEVVEIRTDEDNTMKLYEAALRGCKATLNSLVQKDPLILNKVSLTSFSETPLHISALLGHLDFTKALLNQKPKLTTELDSLKRSPLHLASAEGHIKVVKALLHANSDVCLVPDQDGRIPLHLAVMRGRVAVIQELISARPESIPVHLDGDTVLHLCVKYNHLEALKLLVTMVDNDEFLIKSRNREGNTILHSAVMLKQLETIKFLYSLPEVKARANALSGIGFTTLDVLEHSPRDFKSFEIRDILMEAGVRRAKDPNNVTPPSPPTVVVNTKARPTKWCSKWMNYLKHKSNWVEETQGTLMVVATVIATVTFQAATNPPGGVWQQDDEQSFSGKCNETLCRAGEAVLASVYSSEYLVFLALDFASFIGSLSVLLLIMSGFLAKSKVCTWLLTIAMIFTVTFLALTFLFGVYLVTPEHLISQYAGMANASFYIWLGLLVLVGLIDTIRFIYWLVKKLRKLRKTLTCLAVKNAPSSVNQEDCNISVA